MNKPIVYWFRNDLRLHDNPALLAAIASGIPIVAVYILDDSQMTNHQLGFSKMGKFRYEFLLQSLHELSGRLTAHGSQLLYFRGDTTFILQRLYSLLDAQFIFAQNEYAHEELLLQNRVASFAKLQLIDGSMLVTPQYAPFSIDKSPFYYTAFKNKVWDLANLSGPSSDIFSIKPFQPIPDELLQMSSEIPQASDDIKFKGGELAGLKHLKDYIESGAVLRYTETRNQLSGDHFSSHLAPWLANGALSPRMVMQSLNGLLLNDELAVQSVQTIKEQLIWRDYFRYLIMRYGARLFWLSGLRSSTPAMYNDLDSFDRWRQGKTGVDIVDALMNELRATGFMSNRGRMLVSYYLAKELKVNWQWGAAWFEHLLIDYDVYSNYGNWAYQSGRGTDSRVNRRFNLKKQAEKFDVNGEFRTKWCDLS